MSRRPFPRRRHRNTSSLLINEPSLQVSPSLAVALGLNEAMFLQQLHFWTSGDFGKERDGELWVYNTYEQWHKQFPFWSISTLRRIIGSLEKDGYFISSTEHNDHPADRTKRYAVNYDKLDELAEGLSESADHVINMSSPTDQTDQMDVISSTSSSLIGLTKVFAQSWIDIACPAGGAIDRRWSRTSVKPLNLPRSVGTTAKREHELGAERSASTVPSTAGGAPGV